MHGGSYSASDRAMLDQGACALGSAFQKVNFLRDLSADFQRLGRSYFPNVNVTNFDEATKLHLVADIAKDIEVAAAALPLLPKSARAAVTAALVLFAELNKKLLATPAAELIQTRIRVSNLKKLWLVLKAKIGARP
jgi:phytoene/squalene synthetase